MSKANLRDLLRERREVEKLLGEDGIPIGSLPSFVRILQREKEANQPAKKWSPGTRMKAEATPGVDPEISVMHEEAARAEDVTPPGQWEEPRKEKTSPEPQPAPARTRGSGRKKRSKYRKAIRSRQSKWIQVSTPGQLKKKTVEAIVGDEIRFPMAVQLWGSDCLVEVGGQQGYRGQTVEANETIRLHKPKAEYIEDQ